MRKIEWTGQFKRDRKRELKGRFREIIDADLKPIIAALANDIELEPKLRDHALSGNWKDHRDCHIKPDLVLIYRFPNNATLQLVRLGSHSELAL